MVFLTLSLVVSFQVTKYWSLSDELCDAWVAFDVMACTASILNLTAISVDRLVKVPSVHQKVKQKMASHLTWKTIVHCICKPTF